LKSKARLVELREKKDIQLLRMLIEKYHTQGIPRGGGAGRRHRYFVLEKEGYWLAGCWLHDSTPFAFLAKRFRIPEDRSYFIRRICKFVPNDVLVDFLELLAEKLKHDGFEALWTLGLPDHSNALYRKAGFKELGKSPRTGHPVFVLYLR